MANSGELNFNSLNRVIDIVNARIGPDFHYTIDINGFDEFLFNTNDLSDVDIDTLRTINKASSEWHSYIVNLTSLLAMSLDRYSNMVDIYNYLTSISVKNVDLFQLSAPKYKIDATNVPYAIKIVEQKTKEYSLLVKNIKILIGKLESYDAYSVSIYFKTSGLIRSIERRQRNYAFAY